MPQVPNAQLQMPQMMIPQGYQYGQQQQRGGFIPR
jgi:hypothetical protein